jgi:putative ABC transport system permease protein
MRDFRALVRARIAPLGLAPAREQKVIDEWAAQLEDTYESLRSGGASDDDAWEELQQLVPTTGTLRRELLPAESVLLQAANADRESFLRRAARVIASQREALTTGFAGDLRSALRSLARDRVYNATIILTLAVCLGANAAIFTVVNAILLRPLPIAESERVVGIGDVYPTITPNDILSSDVPSYFDRMERVPALDAHAMFTFWYETMTIDGVAQEVRGMRATPSLFPLLRAAPALGRTFLDSEGEIGAEQKVILSHGLWQRLYGGDPGAIGGTLRLGWSGQLYTIVGVMPREFWFFDRGYDGHASASEGVQFWIPLAFTPAQKADGARTRYGYTHIGRIRPNATLAQVQEQVNAVRADTARRFPQFSYDDLGMFTAVTPLQDALTRGIRRTLYLLWGGAAFVLLIGAINIANLALARTTMRARELATRVALGAARVRVARQLVVEAMVPTAVGGIAGVVVASAILAALAAYGLDNLPSGGSIRIDGAVVAFIALVSTALGLGIGIAPAIAMRDVRQGRTVLGSSRTSTAGRGVILFRRGLVVAQVALSVVLLIAASLLLSSFRNLLRVDGGFSPEGVVTATIFPPPSRYPNAAAVVSVSNRLLERIRAIPGVQSAGLTSNIALSGSSSPSGVSLAPPGTDGAAQLVPSVVAASTGYFEAMGTPLVRGRYFEERDRDNAPAVAIVDERLAARLWAGADPIGQTIYRGSNDPFTVVGVVREVRLESLAAVTNENGVAYFPHGQAPPMRRLRWVAVKAAGDPATIVRQLRSALAQIDPDLPLSDVQTMRERTSKSLISQRLALALATMFGGVALFLSMLGIYGVLNNAVAHRAREFGIRMALGSTVSGIFQLVIKEGVILIGAGVLSGLAAARVAGDALEGQLFGVTPGDPLIAGVVVLSAGCAALLACLGPALRATRVAPVEVMFDQ